MTLKLDEEDYEALGVACYWDSLGMSGWSEMARQRQNAYQRAYAKSAKGIAARKRYQKSDARRNAQRRYRAKYVLTPNGKAALKEGMARYKLKLKGASK